VPGVEPEDDNRNGPRNRDRSESQGRMTRIQNPLRGVIIECQD
jgi:hypothetical protein